MKQYFKTIVLSDIHIGRAGSRHRDVTNFLKSCTCENLILNGDILDQFNYTRPELWKKRHWRLIRVLSRKISEEGVNVVFVKGNSDQLPNDELPLQMGPLKLVDRMEYESFGKKYLVVHGDIFDTFQRHLSWLAFPGKLAFMALIKLHRMVYGLKSRLGISQLPLSEKANGRVNLSAGFVEAYEKSLCTLAKKGGYDGIICGHLHIPAIKEVDNVTYMNSGDWLESSSALVEYPNGEWNHIFYSDSKYTLRDSPQKREKDLNSLRIYPSFNVRWSNI